MRFTIVGSSLRICLYSVENSGLYSLGFRSSSLMPFFGNKNLESIYSQMYGKSLREQILSYIWGNQKRNEKKYTKCGTDEERNH